MAQSGITPSAETLSHIDELRKNNSQYFFATFKVSDVSIVPESTFSKPELKAQGDAAVAAAFEKEVWPEFVKNLSDASGARFAVIDFTYLTKDNRIQKPLVSVSWCPNKASAKEKMTFAATRTSFDVKINIGKRYQANDEADLDYATVLEWIQKI